MVDKKFKIIGLSVSITVIMFLALALFISSIRVIFQDWFEANAIIIAIITGVIIVIGLATGSIALSSFVKK